MSFLDPYPDYEGAFNRSILQNKGGWLVEGQGTKAKQIKTKALSDYLFSIKEGKWLNLMIGRQRPASEMISFGVRVAIEIADDFNALMPVYLNRSPNCT